MDRGRNPRIGPEDCPNGRRDEFEKNSHLANLITHLNPIGHEIAKQCRNSSMVRNRHKTFDLTEQKILDKIGTIKQGAISKSTSALLKREMELIFLS